MRPLFTPKRRDERGAILIVVAVLSIAMLGVAALAVDLGSARQQTHSAQSSADAAALAGAQELPLAAANSVNAASAKAEAASFAATNVLGVSQSPVGVACGAGVPPNSTCYTANDASITVATPYTSTASGLPSYNLIYVSICEPTTTYFAGAIGATSPIVCREAAARRVNASGGFGMGLIALDPSQCSALTFAGNSTTTLSSNGAVMVNSSCTNSGTGALDSSGASWQLYAGYIGVVGSATLAPCSPPTTCAHTLPVTGINPFADPLNLAAPAVPATTRSCSPAKESNNWRVLQPGRYTSACTFGNSGGTAGYILRPGLYYFEAGFNANGNVPVLCANSGLPTTYAAAQAIGCTGITLYKAGAVTLNGGSGLYLPPASTGTYAGVTLFDGSTQTGQKLNGGNNFLSGTVYAPNAHYDILGNSNINVTGSMIFKTASISGNGTINITVPENATTVPTADDIGLVE